MALPNISSTGGPFWASTVQSIIAKGLSDSVRQERRQEIATIGKCWDFYNGNHIVYMAPREMETKDEFDRKAKRYFNWTRSVINAYVEGVFGLDVNVTFNDPDYTKRWEEQIEPYLDMRMTLELAQRIAEISNTCVVIPRYDADTNSVFWETVRGEFVEFLPDPENPKRIGAIVVNYQYYIDDQHWTRTEVYSRDRIVFYLSRSGIVREVLYDTEAEGIYPYTVKGKGLLLPEIFRPEVDDNSFFGVSTCPDIVVVNEAYNDLWTDLSQIVLRNRFQYWFDPASTPVEKMSLRYR